MVMDTRDEEIELANRASCGDRAALDELASRIRSDLFAQAYADLRHYEDAQDVAASALIQICLHVRDIRDAGSFRSWMRTIVRNETRRSRRRQMSGMVSIDEADDVASEPEDRSLKLDVARALDRLPRQQAQALTLFYLKGMSIAQIARFTGRPAATIRTWLHRGRSRLSHHLKEYGPMTEPLRATIISSEIDAGELDGITSALRDGGYPTIAHVSDPSTVIRLRNGVGDGQDLEFLSPLKESQLVVLDDWAGGHSAFEVMRMIRSDTVLENVPVAMLASRPSDIKTLCAWQAGFDLFLIRPVDRNELADLVRRLRQKTG